MKSRISWTVCAGPWLTPICDPGDGSSRVIKLLAPSRWKFHLSLPDSRRSRNIKRKAAATVVCFLCDVVSFRACASPCMAWYLKASASRWESTRPEDASSCWWKECSALVLWRAARANEAFKRTGSSKAREIRLLKGFRSLSYTMKSLHIRSLSGFQH